MQVMRSGLLSGGYRDESKQIISTYNNFSKIEDEKMVAEEEAHSLQEKIRKLKDEIIRNTIKKEKTERKIIDTK